MYDISYILDHIYLDRSIEKYGVPMDDRSKVIAFCKCGKISDLQIRNVKSNVKKNGSYRCLGCYHRDPLTRSIRSSNMEKWCSTPDNKKKASEISKDLWNRSDYREKISKSSKDVWSSEERRDKLSILMKRLCQEPDRKLGRSIISKDIHSRPEFKKKKSEISTEMWNRPGHREKASAILKKVCGTPEHREKLSKIHKEVNNRIEIREMKATAHEKFLKSGKDSSPERVTQNLLTSMGVEWIRQYRIGHYLFDLFVPSHHLLIECQGEYWHSLNKAKKMDAAKNTFINKYFPEYQLAYLYERDFFNANIVKHKLMNMLHLCESLNNPVSIPFLFSDLRLDIVDPNLLVNNSYYSIAEEFLQTFHSAGYGKKAKIVYGLYVGQKLIGICKFINAQSKINISGFRYCTTLELDRIKVLSEYHDVYEYFINLCVKHIWEFDVKIQNIITFINMKFNSHDSWFINCGWNKLNDVGSNKYYVCPNGFVISEKSLHKLAISLKMTESDYVNLHNYASKIQNDQVSYCVSRPDYINII